MHYYLTQDNRNKVSLLVRFGYGQRSIALVLSVNPSTICRELALNAQPTRLYHARYARLTASRRRARANALRTKLLAYPELAATVQRQLTRNDFPEQIAGWLNSSEAACA